MLTPENCSNCVDYIEALENEDKLNFWNAIVGLFRIGALLNIKSNIPGLDDIITAFDNTSIGALSQKTKAAKLKGFLKTKKSMQTAVNTMMQHDIKEETFTSMYGDLSRVLSSFKHGSGEKKALDGVLDGVVSGMFGGNISPEFKTGLTDMLHGGNLNTNTLETFFSKHGV